LSIITMIFFGFFLLAEGWYPSEKKFVKSAIEKIEE
jgi:hypothetical protein